MTSPPMQRTMLQEQINKMYQTAKNEAARGKRIEYMRLFFAYTFKIVAGGAGLAISFNKWTDWNQNFAIASVVAIFLDTVTQNYKKLLSVAKAGRAYQLTYQFIEFAHNVDMGIVLQQAALANGGTLPEVLSMQSQIDAAQIEQRTANTLRSEIQRIRQATVDEDLKQLEALSLDAERAIAKQQQQGPMPPTMAPPLPAPSKPPGTE